MKKILATLALIAALATAACAAYPTKAVRLIVPYAAGGAADMTARLSSKVAEKYLGQPIVVENRAGGGAVTGTQAGASAKPDGYTLTLLGPGSILNTYQKKVNYTVDSFVPVVQIVQEFDVIVAHKDQFPDLAAMKDYAAAHPGAVTIGVSGALVYDHLESLIFAKALGVELKVVPFNGSAPSMAAFLGKHIDLASGSFAELESQAGTGEIAFLCVFAEKRFPDHPDVPTAKELGYDIVSGPWRGIAAPAGTPDDVLNTIADAYVKAFNDPEFKEYFGKAGLPYDSWLPRAEFTELVKEQAEVLKKTIEEAK